MHVIAEKNERLSSLFMHTKFPCSQIRVRPFRRVQQITSGPRHIAKVQKKQRNELELPQVIPGHIARNELDTRADTICTGINFLYV
jgi:hypothetical protein